MKVLMVVFCVIVVLIALALSWGVTVAGVWLVCALAGWSFDIMIANGLWLVLCLAWNIVLICKEEG